MAINVQQVFDDLANKKTDSLFQYLKDGGDANATGDSFAPNLPLLHAAAASGNIDAVKALVDAGGDLSVDFLGVSIKKHAGSLDVVKYLESKGLVYEDGDLPSQVNDLESLKHLVDEKGLDAKVQVGAGQTLLHFVSAKNMDVIKYLVEKKKLDVNAEDTHGNTPIMQLVREIGDQQYHGDAKDVSKLAKEAHDMCKYFKDHGADINHLNKGESGIKDLFVNSESYYEKSGGGFDFPSAMPNSSHFDQDHANDLVQRGIDLDIRDL